MKLTTLTVSTAFILIVATLLNIGELYSMAGMLAALPLVCYFVGRRQNGGVRAERSLESAGIPGHRRSALDLSARRQPVRRQLAPHRGDARRGQRILRHP